MANYGTHKNAVDLVSAQSLLASESARSMFNPISIPQSDLENNKGILFPIKQFQCPPNAMCPTVVRYVFEDTNELVTGQIYAVYPNCPPIAGCLPKLYAARGKVMPKISQNTGIVPPKAQPAVIPIPEQSFYEKNKTIILVGGGVVLGLILYKNFLK